MPWTTTESVPSLELGRTGVKLPLIGFGTWRYHGGLEPLRTAIELGAGFIDTAEIYGTEEVVGEAISGYRSRVFLATKAAPKNFRRKDLLRAADASLKKLRTDYIDLYQLHWPNYRVPIDETMGAMEELVESGKIRFIGVSNFSRLEMMRAQRALSKNSIASNQVRFSIMDRTIETGLLEHCQKSGVTVIAYSPLENDVTQLRAADPAGVLERIGSAHNKTAAQVALRWVVNTPGVVAIPKASSAAHVREDVDSIGWQLTDQEYAALSDQVRFQRRSALAIRLRRWKRVVAQSVGRQL